ncbi:MAG: AIR carboxylase family protein [Bacteroidia bacterium]|nr:AIR carboxylase family protein [Bacteroidia bacterium]MDW8014716.1 AIR carboxylase family protein [Bacteroidia bacterium]
MSRSEIVLLREAFESSNALEEARSILSQMGIFYREEVLPIHPTIGALRSVIENLGASVCVWAAGRSAYLLPVIVASVTIQQPLIIMPCPNESAPETYLETIFETVRGYPVSFTRPYDAQGAVLLGVQFLASRHPSYGDILSAFVQKRQLQPT